MVHSRSTNFTYKVFGIYRAELHKACQILNCLCLITDSNKSEKRTERCHRISCDITRHIVADNRKNRFISICMSSLTLHHERIYEPSVRTKNKLCSSYPSYTHIFKTTIYARLFPGCVKEKRWTPPLSFTYPQILMPSMRYMHLHPSPVGIITSSFY